MKVFLKALWKFNFFIFLSFFKSFFLQHSHSRTLTLYGHNSTWFSDGTITYYRLWSHSKHFSWYRYILWDFTLFRIKMLSNNKVFGPLIEHWSQCNNVLIHSVIITTHFYLMQFAIIPLLNFALNTINNKMPDFGSFNIFSLSFSHNFRKRVTLTF